MLHALQCDIVLKLTILVLNATYCHCCIRCIKEDDRSGSTGLVCCYDGRRRKLSVANVGDSRQAARVYWLTNLLTYLIF
jgi:serine/threonine protein phosphatase PrpC